MNWDGFLMGLGDFTQDRLKEERQKKMQKELLELKEKYTIEAEERQETRTIAAETRTQGRYDSSLDRIEVLDDGSGVLHRYTKGGTSLDSVPLSAKDAKLIEHKRAAETHDMNLRSKENTMNYQNRSLDLQGQEIAARREANALAARGGGAATADPVEHRIETTIKSIYGDTEKMTADQKTRLWEIGYAAMDQFAQPNESRSYRQVLLDLAGKYPLDEIPNGWENLPRATQNRTPSFRFDLTQPRR